MRERNHQIEWPEGKRFAFTIFDDTDRATLENNRAVYALLYDLGLRTTKSIWAFDGRQIPTIPGVTCDDPDYVRWLLELRSRGFEIAWHLATWETSPRNETIRGLDRFRELFGSDPDTMANHADNKEGMYWGCARFTGWRERLFRLVASKSIFTGHCPGSSLFWGDLCQERIRYVRNWVFEDVDTLGACPWMPYRDPSKPWVNGWFASSGGADLTEFHQLLDPKNIDRLEACGGACIVYTHFGKGFVRDGLVDSAFRLRLEDLASRSGWFVPVSTLLDFLAAKRSEGSWDVPCTVLSRMENRWMYERLKRMINPWFP